MVDRKKELFRYSRSVIGESRVISVMERTPRELFISEDLLNSAYDNKALRIGEGQTISQPLIVAEMLNALEVKKTDTVLEIGTGSGYQTALLSQLANKVVSVERIEVLMGIASHNLENLGYSNIELHLSRKVLGFPASSPYDSIIVSAGASKIPISLIHQLVVGGRMVVPVGSISEQSLLKVTKLNDGYTVTDLGGCQFVPLIGEYGWPEAEVNQQ